MKAYITCPVSHTQERLNLLPMIKEQTQAAGIDPFVFKIGGTAREIFNRDYQQLKTADLIIAEVSETSHGVGIEIGLSYCLGLKRILLIEHGQHVTKLAQGMPDTTVIHYQDQADLKQKLQQILSSL